MKNVSIPVTSAIIAVGVASYLIGLIHGPAPLRSSIEVIINGVAQTEFVAVILGALIGGGITILGQHLVFEKESRQRREEEENRHRVVANGILIKMMKIFSHLVHFKNHLEESIVIAEREGMTPWQATRSIANLPDPVRFTVEEMALLLSLKNNDLFNKTAPFEDIFNSTIELFRTYGELKRDFQSRLPAEMNGPIGTTVLPVELKPYLEPKMAELDDMVGQMLPRCVIDAQEASEILQGLNELFNEKFGMAITVTPIEA